MARCVGLGLLHPQAISIRCIEGLTTMALVTPFSEDLMREFGKDFVIGALESVCNSMKMEALKDEGTNQWLPSCTKDLGV